jgi:hypothetical protein
MQNGIMWTRTAVQFACRVRLYGRVRKKGPSPFPSKKQRKGSLSLPLSLSRLFFAFAFCFKFFFLLIRTQYNHSSSMGLDLWNPDAWWVFNPLNHRDSLIRPLLSLALLKNAWQCIIAKTSHICREVHWFFSRYTGTPSNFPIWYSMQSGIAWMGFLALSKQASLKAFYCSISEDWWLTKKTSWFFVTATFLLQTAMNKLHDGAKRLSSRSFLL